MSIVTRVARPPQKPLLVFDGDCQFCRRWIHRWEQATGELVEYAPFQSARVMEQFPEVARERFEQAVHLVEPNGEVYRGAEAAFRALACRMPWPLWIYRQVPGAAPVGEFAYQLVARHRDLFSVLTRLFWGRHVEQPAYFLARWLFVRLLGIVYGIAFLSLWSQIIGLVGADGIMPAEQTMRIVEGHTTNTGLDRFRAAPTLCWFSTSDSFLNAQCAAGVGLSLLVIAGVAPAPCLFLLWVIYLSLTTVGHVFLEFQWDSLLLETGLLAVFVAPLRLWPKLKREAAPSTLGLWLLRWLLFRLMFASGYLKLASGDPTWRNLTALEFHYETQPLPTWLGWYAHQLPEWVQQASCAAMFGVELIVPFFIFLPRARLMACGLFVLLQLGIALTGNYTFFNLLSVVLCVPLLDDAALARFFPQFLQQRASEAQAWSRATSRGLARRARRGIVAVVAVAVLSISLMEMGGVFAARVPWPSPMINLFRWAAPLRSVNSYGLFRVMTTWRPEIIIEGSRDGMTWQAYEFRDKPGDLKRRPGFVAPHQPRLDWQMWFAALGSYRDNPWFVNCCVRLLQGSPEVLALLEHNPFPDAPPKYIRALLYEYHFTTLADRRADSAWWRREFKGLYCPPFSLGQ
ncbi:MAG TPA: lipase maturation factor family protein [Candidatus Binatia bacterium]|nr:lipase maturation factor family protein [Candidatus Binatia bacterium]